MLELVVENRIKYIPVADATDGGTPILRSKGLKMAPPPKPRAPDTQPPSVENTTKVTMVMPLNLMSESIRPLPTFSFSHYSLLTIFTDRTVITEQNTMKKEKKNHARGLHV